MIIGNGIDIVEIDRIKKAIERRDRFLNRVFTEYEITYISSRKENINTVAGLFAAKEAVSKAIGKGIRGYRWTNIEIGHDDYGKPLVLLTGNAKQIAFEKGIRNLHISISHSDTYAVAFVIAEG